MTYHIPPPDKEWEENSPFPRIGHIGIVCRDVEKTTAYLNSIGIGPFKTMPGRGTKLLDAFYRDKPYSTYKAKVYHAWFGSVEVELLEVTEGESIATEFLETRGEGIEHIGCWVDDLDKEIAKLEKLGIKVIQGGKRVGRNKWAYFELPVAGGIHFQLIQESWTS